LKRRLREIIRQDLLPTAVALDIIVKTAPVAYAATFDALREEMRGAMERLSR
jgi:ribonuclease P protein component